MKVEMAVLVTGSEHRFPAPSSKEGCRKPVLGVCVLGSPSLIVLMVSVDAVKQNFKKKKKN